MISSPLVSLLAGSRKKTTEPISQNTVEGGIYIHLYFTIKW